MSPETPDFPSAVFGQHTIETPEQLRLDFAIAGIGSRFVALAIDTLIQFAIGFVLVIALAVLGALGLLGASGLWAVAFVGFAVFLLMFGYFAIFEILWHGQTPGKRFAGIRVVKDSGRPLAPVEAVGRNLLRIVDSMPGCYAIGIISALLSSRGKRLGDFVAGSVVVVDSPVTSTTPVWPADQRAQAPISGAAPISIEDLRLIEQFIARRSEMTIDLRTKMAQQILARIRSHSVVPEGVGGSAEAILDALALQRRSSGGI